MKACTKCKKIKSLDNFHFKCRKAGYKRSVCKSCISVQTAKKKKLTNLRKFWPHLSVKEARTEYERLLELQQNVCCVCQKSEMKGCNLAVDHDHKTGRVRGLLCFNCNIAIGKLKDSPTLARRLADYLESSNADEPL